jgi:spore coat polysaccharide biosynthesis predicted glycosyltransferase SpsG
MTAATKPRVLFRADAGHDIGFGHVARLCALAEEVTAHGCDPVIMFGGDVRTITSWAHDRGLHVDAHASFSTTSVVKAAEDARVRAVVIDGPQLALDIIPKLPDRVRSVVIDDMGKLALPLSTVVNHNYHALELAASYPNARQRLLGRRYLMLRKDIRRFTRGSCRPRSIERLRVLVTFGGSDPCNATARCLALLPPDRPLELVVVTGPGFSPHAHAMLDIAVKAARTAGHIVDVRRAPEDPGALFATADAAICSAGGTLGELAYLGCPALAYAIVQDQLRAARQQVRDGMISGGRSWLDTEDDLIRADMLKFLLDDAGRLEQRHRALATADSDGPRRIIEEMLAA